MKTTKLIASEDDEREQRAAPGRKVADVLEAAEHGADDHHAAEQRDPEQRAQAREHRVRAAPDRHAPDVIERVLDRERDTPVPAQMAIADADRPAPAALPCSEWTLRLQLRADHREVGEGRVEHAVLQLGIALERVARAA